MDIKLKQNGTKTGVPKHGTISPPFTRNKFAMRDYFTGTIPP
jgi:hypothetical protein